MIIDYVYNHFNLMRQLLSNIISVGIKSYIIFHLVVNCHNKDLGLIIFYTQSPPTIKKPMTKRY